MKGVEKGMRVIFIFVQGGEDKHIPQFIVRPIAPTTNVSFSHIKSRGATTSGQLTHTGGVNKQRLCLNLSIGEHNFATPCSPPCLSVHCHIDPSRLSFLPPPTGPSS